MNIRIINETNKHVDIYDETCAAMRQLFTNDVNVYVVITNERIPRQTSLAIGACCRVTNDVYIVYVKPTHDIVHTLRHELYHVFQYRDGSPLDCNVCNQFARLSSNAHDAF